MVACVHAEKEIQTHKICTTEKRNYCLFPTWIVCVCVAVLNCFTVLTFIVLVEYIGKKVKLRLSARDIVCTSSSSSYFYVVNFISFFFLVNKSAQAQAHNKERVSSSNPGPSNIQWNVEFPMKIIEINIFRHFAAALVVALCACRFCCWLVSFSIHLSWCYCLAFCLVCLSRVCVFVISHLTRVPRNTWEGGIFHHTIPTYLNL